MLSNIRVLIAEDSPTARLYLKTLINESDGFTVIGEARDGTEAISLTQQLKPDIVTMDINMPITDGLTATRQIMSDCPTPVVVVSGVVGTEVDLSMEALKSGALAVLPKLPDRKRPEFEERKRELLYTLKAMSGVKVISRRDKFIDKTSTRPMTAMNINRPKPQLAVIGASTGGPSAIQRVVAKLPPDFSLPLVIVQHMPDEFLGGLARWLRSSTKLQVQMAHNQIELRPGVIYVALGGAHLRVQRLGSSLYTVLSKDMGNERFQPSINILFESVANVCGAAAIGVILTGMGDDGAEGLLKLRQAGAYTFAQDATSSTVYGMPNAAVEKGAVERVVNIENLPTEILKLI
jgi:two-component system, chemotaxis family, protein-glutamate methylesterase/glutaminase